MILGNDALAVQRGGERNLKALDQRLQLGSSPALHSAEADQGDDQFLLPQRLGDRPRCGGSGLLASNLRRRGCELDRGDLRKRD